MHPEDTLPCFRAHMGIWAIEPVWFQQAVAAVQAGLWPVQARGEMGMPEPGAAQESSRLYFRAREDVAIIRLLGGITKGASKFGGASTVLTRQALRQAVADEDIHRILLVIDSPGGQVAGVNELAHAVDQAAEEKPVAAYIEDLGASAAYWIASQAQRVSANPTAEVGSIGVFAVLQDLSGLARREDVRVIVKSTGPYKGMGVPGAPITQEQEDEVQKRVDEFGQFFFGAVQSGRRLTQSQLAAVTDGRTWLAQEAQGLGLIDGVESFDSALDALARMRPKRRMRAQAERTAQRSAIQEGLLHAD